MKNTRIMTKHFIASGFSGFILQIIIAVIVLCTCHWLLRKGGWGGGGGWVNWGQILTRVVRENVGVWIHGSPTPAAWTRNHILVPRAFSLPLPGQGKGPGNEDIATMGEFSDLVDLWVIKINKSLILCARSTS